MERLRMLLGLARAVAQARTDPQAIVDILVRTLVQQRFADGCCARLEASFCVGAWAHCDLAAEEYLRDRVGSAPFGLLADHAVLADGKPLLWPRIAPSHLDELSPEGRAYARKFSLRSLLAVPVRTETGVVGAICLWRDRTDDPFTQKDLDTAHACCEHVALALENAAMFRALQVSEQRFELAARATQDVLWDWDVRTGRIDWNEAVTTTLGWPKDQVRNTLDWWTEQLHPDDRDRVLAGLHRAIEENPTNVRWQDEYRFRRGDGTWAHFVDRGYVVRDAEERPVRAVGSMQDVSDRVDVASRLARREESYRAFIANSSEGIWCFESRPPIPIDLPIDAMIDALYERTTLVECNDAMARKHGYERAEQLLGAALGDVLPRSDPKNLAVLREFFTGGFRLTDVESVEPDRYGREHYILNNVVGVVRDGLFERAWGTQRDVTELRRQEAALARYSLLAQQGLSASPEDAEEVLSLVMRAGRMGAWSKDLVTGAVTWSRELEEIFGLPPGGFDGDEQTFYAMIHPDDRAAVRAAAERAIAEGSDYAVEFRFTRATGEPGWMEGRGRAMHDGERPRMMYGLGIDITARKQSEQALRESQQLFARAFGKNPNVMSLNLLPDCHYLDVNDAMIAATGYSRAELLGRTPAELGLFVDPADLARVSEQIAERGSARDVELRVRARHGRVDTILWSAEIIEYRGRPCVLTVSTDISARKRTEEALQESEERFHQIAAHIDQVFWMTEYDPPQRVIYVSPSCERVWGLPAEAMYAEPERWIRAIHPEDLAAFMAAYEQWIAEGQHSWSHVYRVVRPDGAVRWVHDRGRLIRDPDGRPWRLVGLAEDITERRLAERERERLVADLHAAVALRDDFLAVASHELRTPLTALGLHLGHLTRMVTSGATDQERLAVRVSGAVRQIDRLTALVDSLIDTSRMSLGTLALDLVEFDLADLLRQLARQVRDDVRRARCELVVDAPEHLPVRWDRNRIGQALGHLVANALKYGAGAPVALRVREHADVVEIAVEDRGIGIAAADVRRIFDRFERAVSSSHYGGLGLGLYIARQIVEAHGGAVDVSSQPGQGATFRVRLPRAAQPRTAAP